jgi:3-phenylpropionate/trans-cinnamate dioxygenase ferredoxin reductase subunit
MTTAPEGPVVVVGAGVAGVRLVRRLRARGYTGRVVLVDSQQQLPYDRPPLSKGVLRGEQDLPVLLDADALVSLAVDWRPGVRAVGLDTSARLVLLDGGESIRYDAVVLATGARARMLPGLASQVLRTWEDASRLRDRLTEDAALVVVGAGVVGCEVAASLRSRGVAVHLVDPLPAPMIRVLGPVIGREAITLHQDHGVNLHLGTTVESYADGEVLLANGTWLRADVVLAAIGTEPDLAWLAGSGLHIDNGIWCDDEQRTSAPDVFAVGDAAAPGGRRAEHWTAATQQADRAVASLLGTRAPGPEPHYWWSDQYDVKLQGLGEIAEADDLVVGRAGLGLIGLFGRQGRLIGAVGVAATAQLMRLRGAVLDGSDLAPAAADLDDARWVSPHGDADGDVDREWGRQWRAALLSTVNEAS